MIGVAAAWERLWPWVGAVAAAAGWHWARMSFPTQPETMLGTAATVASVFASFLGVAEAIIIGMKGSDVYKVLEKAGYTSLLYGYLRAGILGAVLLACLSVIGFFIEPHLLVSFSTIWVAVAVFSLLSFTRIVNIFFKILHHS